MNEITREMIEDYQLSQLKIYDERDDGSGNITKYAYKNAGFVIDPTKDFVAPAIVDDNFLGAPATDQDIFDYEEEIKKTAADLREEISKLEQIEHKIEKGKFKIS